MSEPVDWEEESRKLRETQVVEDKPVLEARSAMEAKVEFELEKGRMERAAADKKAEEGRRRREREREEANAKGEAEWAAGAEEREQRELERREDRSREVLGLHVSIWRRAGHSVRHRKALEGMGGYPEDGVAFFSRLPPGLVVRANKKVASAGGTLLLFGPRGIGKTQLACWLGYQDARRAGEEPDGPTGQYSQRYVSWPDLLHDEKRSFNTEEKSPIDEARGVHLLILDEIFSGLSTEWERSEFTRLIDYRYGAMLPTIVVGNIAEGEVQKALGAAAFSRLNEAGGAIHCNWEPYR